MKQNLPISQIEEDYSSDINILSTTDLKGQITYVNKGFTQVSGFEEQELLGKSHNIVRHPDMPPAAFEGLWKTVKGGCSWMGIVKNRCKNGNHYWVDAYVTPIEKNGLITEYQSVRRKPSQDYVERAEQVYTPLMAGKVPTAIKDGLSLLHRTLLCMLLPLIVALTICFTLQLDNLSSLLLMCAALTLSTLGTIWIFKPFHALVKKSQAIVNNPVARYIYSGRRDDIGQLALTLKMLESESAALVGRISDTAEHLTGGVSELSSAVSQSESGARQQFAETDQVAAAVHEMSASIQEVAANAQTSSTAAMDSLTQAQRGKNVVDDSVRAIQQLQQQISLATQAITELKESSTGISSILDVIGEIADQTNLLALNAAIEAARAGDAGRGFSVVADEVRSLASKTRTSTEQIRTMIEQLQVRANRAVNVMESGQRHTDQCVEQSSITASSLTSIYQSIEQINDMNTQIASAVEQQSAVADEINKSIYTIRDMSEQNLNAATSSNRTGQDMLSISNGFSELSAQFWAKQV